MIAATFTDNKSITGELFVKETFDRFCVYEASVTTHSQFTVDGERQTEYDPEETEAYVFWRELRPIFYQIIKGKKLPLQFRLIFRLSENQVRQLLEKNPCDFKEGDIESLHFIIQYKLGRVTVTTGSSYRIFSLDKTLDKVWDKAVLQYLDHYHIEYRTEI